MDRTILLVDDEEAILRTLKRQLSLEGYQVLVANSAMEGLKVLEEHKVPVIISDQRMPQMTGSEFLAEVKNKYPDTVRLILSGYADFNAVSEAINNGEIYKFLNKPWEEDTLLSHIEGAFACHSKLVKQTQAGRVVDNAIESVAICDSQGKVESVNKSFCFLTEYDETEILGREFNLFDQDREDEYDEEELRANLKEKGGWQGEVWFRKKSGRSFPVFLSVVAVCDGNGLVRQYTYSFIDISNQKTELLEYQEYHDMLTGLANRNAFSERLSEFIFNAEHEHFPIAIVFIDIKQFSQVNQLLGYRIGDVALMMVAERLKQWSQHGELIARLGGDEFAVLLADLDRRVRLTEYLNELQAVFEKPVVVEGHNLNLKPRVGVSVYPVDGHTSSDLMQHANVALCKAGTLDASDCLFYTPDMELNRRNRLFSQAEIRQAIKEDQFKAHFIPMVNGEEEIIGAEAILRWQHPEIGLILPCEFMPLANESGLIADVEKLFLLNICECLSQWNLQSQADKLFLLTLSDKTIKAPGFVAFLESAIAKFDLPSQCLCLGMKESDIAAEYYQMELALNTISNIGVKLAIDDFGSNVASLRHLTQLPVGLVRLDHSYPQALLVSDHAKNILTSLLEFCHKLCLKIAIQGVNSQMQQDYFKTVNCDFMQGEIFSHALDEDDFGRLILPSQDEKNES